MSTIKGDVMSHKKLNIGENIKKYRQSLSITQQKLAKTMNLERSTISKYETNQNIPDINTLVELADIFDCSLDELVGRDL